MPKDKIFFTSDAHLGSPVHTSSIATERSLAAWMESVEAEAKAIYFLGDMLDFWMEYRTTVPKGFIRFLATMARLQERGTEIHYLVGNHDLWLKDYFQKELGIEVHHHHFFLQESLCRFRLSHGDEEYRLHSRTEDLLYRLFRNKIAQLLARSIHPRWLLPLGSRSSVVSRKKGYEKDRKTSNLSQEWIVEWAKERSLQLVDCDYLLFGHRHILKRIMIEGLKPEIIFLGDWLYHNSYACWDGESLSLYHQVSEGNPLGVLFS